MVYKWQGFNYSVSAQTVGEELEKLEAKKPNFTAADVVNAARSTRSKLHKLFEWDDTKAAESWRTQQAKVMLHNLSVVTENAEPVRAFVRITAQSRDTAEYMNITSAMEDEDSREIVLSNALMELKAFQKKYHALQEFSKLMDVIEELTA